MTSSAPPKRTWRPWYLLPERPLCRTCQIPCTVKRTQLAADGARIQHRYCPQCGSSIKTMYHANKPPVDQPSE